jgi:glycopeptide antibiotics resistance protein
LANKKILHAGWVAWVLTIAWLSFIPGDQLPDITWDLISIDTLVHFGMYTVLAGLQFLAFFKPKMNLSRPWLYVLVALAGITFGFFVELVQGSFIYRRYFDWGDVVANTFGTVFGLVAMALTSRKYYKLP